jgi:lipoprotein-releasing system permease protein
MMLSFSIALRFLKKSPLQTFLIVLGIAVGISVQIFIGSLISSLQAFLIETTLGASPHIVIAAASKGDTVRLTNAAEKQLIDDTRITAVLPQRTVSAIYSSGSGSTPLSIKCSNAPPIEEIYKLKSKITEGVFSVSDGTIMIGAELAKQYDLAPDDMMSLTLPDRSLKELRVSGVFDLGSKQANETSAFAGWDFGKEALGVESNRFTAIELQLADVFTSTAVAGDLEGTLTEETVTDWQVDQKSLLDGLNAQSTSTIMIQVFVIIAVALGIASTLSISAIQKTRQIGILKALGLTDGRSAFVFLWQGVLFGVFGTGAGILLGLGLIAVFQATAGSQPGSFPITPQPEFILISAGIGMTIAVLSSLLPSRRTAKLDPIEVIQSGG